MKKYLFAFFLIVGTLMAQTKTDISKDTKNSLPGTRLGSTPFTTLSTNCTGAQTWNVNNQLLFNAKLTTTGACTLNLTNPVAGGNYVLVLIKGSGGSITLGTGCNWAVAGGGSGSITQTSTVGAIDVMAFQYDGVNCYVIFNTNFN